MIEFDQGTLAEVGASWLFTRYVVDQFGDTLPKKLVQTTAVGANNVLNHRQAEARTFGPGNLSTGGPNKFLEYPLLLA